MGERVWDRFLTEQDKATLVGKADRRIGFGERPALLLIDLYRWVFGDKPEVVTEAIKTWPGSCGLAGWNSLPYIQKLLGKAREVGIPIIHVTGMDGVAVEPWAFRRDNKKRATMDPIPECPKIRGLLCFFHERGCDIYVDGELIPQPQTKWARALRS